jgi:hypothetical protein
MAVRKATRSNFSAQPQAKPARRPDHQLKSEIFETLHQFNRGFATALSALGRLGHKDRLPGPRIFPAACLRDYRDRTEALRADANRELLCLIAGHEDRDSARFTGKNRTARSHAPRS